ncbi:hypothetical protein [Anaerolinea sp.]|uniref:hypothetical protein n=1 Tax=Anaerolinea sp. TaxID=1872519 RepID=UPI002ACD72DE|nr:hypothetical protein [Anaerolinea sp.]
MPRNRDWQERGVRIGGRVLSEKEAQELVREIRKRIRDPKVRKEVEEFLAGRQVEISPEALETLRLILVSITMMRPKT